jgi:hypothetical protein
MEDIIIGAEKSSTNWFRQKFFYTKGIAYPIIIPCSSGGGS